MSLITLTSDLGKRDFYLPSIEGLILRRCPDTRFIDINHNIQPFHLGQAAFILKNSYAHFPKGSIHVMGVLSDPKPDRNYLVVKHREHFFLAADNGVFGLLLDSDPQIVVKLSGERYPLKSTFACREVLAMAACDLALGKALNSIGEPSKINHMLHALRPVKYEHSLIGQVIHIDRFGNLITNISDEDLKNVIEENRELKIFVGRIKDPIHKISENYHDVTEGERVAFISSTGFLEIAINQGAPGVGGGASELLGIHMDDIIRIEFQ